MTNRQPASSPIAMVPYVVAWGVGGIEGILVLRLLAKLLAARPSHPLITLLYQVSEPLIRFVDILDEGQPRFGAILELSTLVMIGLVLLGGSLCWMAVNRVVSGPPATNPLDMRRKRS